MSRRRKLHFYGTSPSGGMMWAPYGTNQQLHRFRLALGLSSTKGRWVHNPFHVARRAVGGAGLATAIAAGNLATRGYRQKPVVRLQKAEHRRVAKVLPPKRAMQVDIPSVSSRRTKNILLSNSKAMPYRRKSKVSYRRKGRKGRPRRRRVKKLPPLVLPRQKVVRFRMVFGTQISAIGGAITVNAIKANDLNDPSGSLTSQLPLGVDQWASQYQKYIVLGSRMKARLNNSANTGMVICGIHLDDDSTALSSHSHYRELPLTKQCTLTAQKDYGIVSMNYSGRRFWRLTNIKDDSEQEGTFSTTPGSPTDIAYYHLYVQDLVGSNSATIDAQIELEWIVLLTEPVTLAQSSL